MDSDVYKLQKKAWCPNCSGKVPVIEIGDPCPKCETTTEEVTE